MRDAFGLGELYVADLDAIAGGPAHRELLAALAAEARVMVDAGSAEPDAVRELLALGAARVVIGTETLARRGGARAPAGRAPGGAARPQPRPARRRASCRPIPSSRGSAPRQALARLARFGVREAIVLDLARVGSGEGPDVALLRALRASFPELALIAGGGVRDAGRPAHPGRGRGGRRARRHRPARRRDRSRGAARAQLTSVSRRSTIAAAMSTPVARSAPYQPGMPLTSITWSRPSAPGSRSTPA